MSQQNGEKKRSREDEADFAPEFEKHSKGFGSRMLAKMGYEATFAAG